MSPKPFSTIIAVAVVVIGATTAAAQNYARPIVAPASGSAPYVTAYRDDNSGSAKQDFTCGDHTYNGHNGTDIGIGGFAVMDAGSRDVVAGADGTVSFVQDGCSDRCTSGSCGCGGGFGNYVRIDHADGKRTFYGHLKNNSLRVQNGQRVTCGTVLGKVGSSGNSTGPHLHFEVRHPSNVSDDPFGGSCGGPSSYWISQGAYRSLPSATCPNSPPPPPPAPTTGTLRGVVFHDTGAGTDDMTRRVAGASVVVIDPALGTTAAGVNAEWTIAVATGARTIRASAPGYQTAERTCDVEASGDSWCSIGLLPLPAPEPEPIPEPEPEPAPEPTPEEGPEEPAPEEPVPGDKTDGDPGTGTNDPESEANVGGPLQAPLVTSGCSQSSGTAAPMAPLALVLLAGTLRRRRRP